MSCDFDRWEKDPFFLAAEEVQQSADRMESTYRTWIHALKDDSSMWNPDEIRRDLQTAVGTTKWQLEEFERAVKSSYSSSTVDAKDRHRDFVIALLSQISKIESSLNKSAVSSGKPPVPCVRLNEGESDELAMFLSGSVASRDKSSAKVHAQDQLPLKPLDADKAPSLVELAKVKPRHEKFHGHRRTASASANIGNWKIAVEDDSSLQSSSSAQFELPPRKIPSVSGFLNTMDSACKLKCPKNGYRKLILPEQHQDADTAFLLPQHLPKGINTCYERCKSCLGSCDECYDKQLYGWYGALQRQLRRSQYHIQYTRPVQLVMWTVLVLCLIVVVAVRTI